MTNTLDSMSMHIQPVVDAMNDAVRECPETLSRTAVVVLEGTQAFFEAAHLLKRGRRLEAIEQLRTFYRNLEYAQMAITTVEDQI